MCDRYRVTNFLPGELSAQVHQNFCQVMTYSYGRTMKKAMATFDINPQNWYELAADRVKWHAMIK